MRDAKELNMRNLLSLALIVAIFSAVLTGDEPAATSRPAVRIAYETTRILKPLGNDGLPDYLAALNQSHSKGVTSENNAAVLVVEACGLTGYSAKTQPEALRILGMKAPQGPFVEVNKEEDKEIAECLKVDAIKVEDHETVTACIEQNQKPLEVLVSASKRTRWYFPMFPESPGTSIYSCRIGLSKSFVPALRVLAARARFSAAKGQWQDARNDLLTLRRLGALAGQGTTLVGEILALTCEVFASQATMKIALEGKLDSKAALAMIGDIEGAPGDRPKFEAIDACERYSMLETILHFSKLPPEQVAKEFLALGSQGFDESQAQQPSPEQTKYFADLFRVADWSEAMRRANRPFDSMSSAMKLPTVPEQIEAVEKAQSEFARFRTEFAKKVSEKLQPGDKENATFLGDMLVVMLVPTMASCHKSSTVTTEQRELCKATLALRAYMADHGKYPPKIEDLVPKYLKTAPKDIFSGAPVKYRSQGTGYVVYSIGYDLKDDGGDGGKNGHEPDIVIECRN